MCDGSIAEVLKYWGGGFYNQYVRYVLFCFFSFKHFFLTNEMCPYWLSHDSVLCYICQPVALPSLWLSKPTTVAEMQLGTDTARHHVITCFSVVVLKARTCRVWQSDNSQMSYYPPARVKLQYAHFQLWQFVTTTLFFFLEKNNTSYYLV